MAQKPLPRGISIERAVDKNGSLRVIYRVRVYWEYKQITVGRYDNLTVAKAARETAQLEIIRGTFVPPAERRRRHKAHLAAELEKQTTVEEWFETWISALENDTLRPRSPATLVSYRSTIQTWILPTLGERRLVDVTAKDLAEIVDAAAKKGPGAAQNVVRHGRAMLNAAATEGAGGLTKAPAMPKLQKAGTRHRGDDEVPTLEELRTIAAKMPPHLQLAPELATWAALRVGELIGLQRGDFLNLDAPELAELRISRQWNVKGHGYSEPKDDSAGTVALPPFLLPAIRAHLERYVLDSPSAPVFPSSRDSAKPVSYNALFGAWSTATEGMRHPFALHALRHLGLTEYAKMGATGAEIQRRGRHKDASASARYQHSSAERDRALAMKLHEHHGPRPTEGAE